MMNLLVHKFVCPYLIVLCKNLLNSFPGAPVCVFVAKSSFGFTAIHGSSLSELYKFVSCVIMIFSKIPFLLKNV